MTMQRAATDRRILDDVPPAVYEVLRSTGQPLDHETRAVMETGIERLAPGAGRFGGDTYDGLSVGPVDSPEEAEAERVSRQVGVGSAGAAPMKGPGCDFTQVRVHTDAAANASAEAVNARAFTVGSHVVFGAGRYAPGTLAGRELIAHELTHVVQQGKASGASLSRQPEQPTRRQVARDNHLRRLAVWPGEALLEWRSLSEGERTVVVMYMIGNYGADFATEFNNHAKDRRRRRPVINVTNVNQPPQQLRQRGYRYAVTAGGIEKWVRPNGDEFWYIVPSQSRPPENQPPPTDQPPQPSQQQPASNPSRYDPSADPVRLFGRERQVREGATIMNYHGRAVQHEDGTIVLYPEGSSGRVIFRQTPGGSAYEFYGEDGEKSENVFLVVDTDDVFGGTGAATP